MTRLNQQVHVTAQKTLLHIYIFTPVGQKEILPVTWRGNTWPVDLNGTRTAFSQICKSPTRFVSLCSRYVFLLFFYLIPGVPWPFGTLNCFPVDPLVILSMLGPFLKHDWIQRERKAQDSLGCEGLAHQIYWQKKLNNPRCHSWVLLNGLAARRESPPSQMLLIYFQLALLPWCCPVEGPTAHTNKFIKCAYIWGAIWHRLFYTITYNKLTTFCLVDVSEVQPGVTES